MSLRLDARLRAILYEIDCHTLADIGCDHGKIAVGALLENKAAKAIAADISPSSLHKCRLLGDKSGVADRLDCRLGDGFTPIKEGEADFAVIAGMGGRTIIKILSESSYRGKLLLMPHQDAEELRKYLSGKYNIDKDYVIDCSGRFYNIIAASPGAYVYTACEIFFGRNLPQSEAFKQMLVYERHKLSTIAETCGDRSCEAATKLKEAVILCRKYGI